MHSTMGKLNLASLFIFCGSFGFFSSYMCMWLHYSLCAFLPPPCRVQNPRVTIPSDVLGLQIKPLPIQPKLSCPYLEWQVLRVFTIQSYQVYPIRSRSKQGTPLFTALLRFYSASSPVVQHLSTLFWSSPFSTAAWSLQISLCPPRKRHVFRPHVAPLLFSPASGRRSRAGRKRWCCMHTLSRSLGRRIWPHLPATSSQSYCLKSDVILSSDLPEEDKTAEGRVRLHRVLQSENHFSEKQCDKPELYFAIIYFLSITEGVLFLV